MGIALLAGWMTQIGLSVVLPAVAIVIGRTLSMAGGGDGSWGEHADDPRQSGWHLVHATIFAGSVFAGWLACTLAPGKTARTAASLIMLVIVSKLFQQLPMRPPPLALAEWTLSPCVGIVAGSLLARRMQRRPSAS